MTSPCSHTTTLAMTSLPAFRLAGVEPEARNAAAEKGTPALVGLSGYETSYPAVAQRGHLAKDGACPGARH